MLLLRLETIFLSFFVLPCSLSPILYYYYIILKRGDVVNTIIKIIIQQQQALKAKERRGEAE